MRPDFEPTTPKKTPLAVLLKCVRLCGPVIVLCMYVSPISLPLCFGPQDSYIEAYLSIYTFIFLLLWLMLVFSKEEAQPSKYIFFLDLSYLDKHFLQILATVLFLLPAFVRSLSSPDSSIYFISFYFFSFIFFPFSTFHVLPPQKTEEDDDSHYGYHKKSSDYINTRLADVFEIYFALLEIYVNWT